MLNNMTSSLTNGSKFVGSLNVPANSTLKAVVAQKVGLTASIGSMNLYDYYTKEEIKQLFGEIVTLKKASYFDFPNVGEPSTLYVDIGAGATYIWDTDTSTYECIGKDYEKIQEINGGNANE